MENQPAEARCGSFLHPFKMESPSAFADPAAPPRRIPTHQREVGHIVRNYRAGSNHRESADSDARQYRRVRAYAGPLANASSLVIVVVDSGARAKIVCERHAGPHEHPILNSDAGPQANSVFDHHAVADVHSPLDVTVIADVALSADNGAFKNVHVCPDACAGPNLI